MRDSLTLGGLELLDSDTYQILDGQRRFGDPQIVVEKIRSQLSVGSFVTGDATDNRTISLQVLISGPTRAAVAAADSALRAVVNSSAAKTLVWTPSGTGLPTVWDVYRGQVTTAWSKKWEAAGHRVVTVVMDALPFGRSDTASTLSGSSSSVQLGDFAQTTEYAYKIPNQADSTLYLLPDVPFPNSGTANAKQTSPPPIDGSGCMRVDYGWFRTNIGGQQGRYQAAAKLDVTGTWDLTGCVSVTLGVVYQATSGGGASTLAWLTLKDSSGATNTFQGGVANKPNQWNYLGFDIRSTTLNLAAITEWTLILNDAQISFFGTDTPPHCFVGELRAFPATSQQASTTYGAVYKLAQVTGDARADATLAFDRGGTNTITGFLAYRAPRDTPPTTPSLLGLTGSAPSAGTTTAPSTFSGTYRVILANAGGSNIAAGGTLTVSQKIAGTTVATTTLTTATVAGGSKWADCGDLTLPLVDVPSEASNTTYTFSFSATSTEVILADTRGFLAWVPVTAAVKYCWVDQATAQRAGGVYGGNASDRSDATSLLALSGAQPSGTPSLQPGDNYMLVYVIDGAATNVTVSYYERWLGERVAFQLLVPADDVFTDLFTNTF